MAEQPDRIAYSVAETAGRLGVIFSFQASTELLL